MSAQTLIDSVEILDSIDLKHSVLKLRSDGIVELHTNDVHVYEIPDAKENVESTGKLTNNKKAPILIVGGTFTSLKKETREFMATEESLKYSKAEAFLITSLAQKILFDFYVRIDKPLVPSKVFTNKEKAIEWLSQFLD